MKKILFVFLFHCLLFLNDIQAQIENVIVETYYISDSNDATDTTGGFLEEGSITYRIYVDLLPNTRLRKIYGDSLHALKFFSTDNFFNNKVDGESFGKDFSKNRLGENTVALDTWLTLGQVTRIGSKTYFGVMKTIDDDGSFIGGINNDGGSAGIAGGLLINNTSAMGLPLFNSDGIDTMTTLPASWFDYGIKDISTNVDSTIFGSAKLSSQFISNDAGLQNSGVMGVNPGINHVLIAQLTTKGEISFELNLEVEENVGSNTRIVKYVAKDDALLPGERISPYLKYPQLCGCTDPGFIEYNAGFACEILDSCKTRIILGCMDSLACNFDPEANLNVPELCCYPGFCNDRDLSIVCPELGTGRNKSPFPEIFPNPTDDKINFQIETKENSTVKYEIFDSLGRLMLEKNIRITSVTSTQIVEVSQLEKAVYFLRLSINDKSNTYIFFKN